MSSSVGGRRLPPLSPAYSPVLVPRPCYRGSSAGRSALQARPLGVAQCRRPVSLARRGDAVLRSSMRSSACLKTRADTRDGHLQAAVDIFSWGHLVGAASRRASRQEQEERADGER